MAEIKRTKYLKLPLQFDRQALVRDLEQVMRLSWLPHFNRQGYTGSWSALPLYAPGGDPNNIIALNTDETSVSETPTLSACSYFKEVISSFKCSFSAIRLLRLEPGGYIKPHRDLKSGYEDDFFRLHIPIVTNPRVDFTLEGERLIMGPGECWYTNVNFVHSVANRGTSDRVHLVIDGQRNDWSDELFFSLAPEESFLREETQTCDVITVRRMIEELEQQENEGAKALIKELEGKLRITTSFTPNSE